MADDGADFSKLMPAISGLMSAISAGQTPAGSNGYVPRSSTFNDGVPNWFSFGQTLSQLGSSGMHFGAGIDTFLQVSASQLMARLQANSGVDAMQMAQQRAAMQVTMEMQYKGLGTALGQSIGLDPNSGTQQMLTMMAPSLIAAVPELQQLAYSAAPTAMFTGGKNIAAALQMLDPLSQIRPGEAAAMRESMYRLGTTDRGFVNMEFTHGANMDEFAEAIEFGADMRVGAADLDVQGMRDSTRARLSKQRFGGRTALTTAETDTLESDVTKVVEKDRLGVGASYTTQVSQAVQQFLGAGATRGDAEKFMQVHNLTAQTGDQANTLETLMRNLEALGKQAGMTSEDLMNAGRAMSAQGGGDALYNAGMAARLGANERMLDEDAKASATKDHRVDTGREGDMAERNVQAALDLNRSDTMRATAAAWRVSQKDRDIIQGGDPLRMQDMLNHIYAGDTAEGSAAGALMNQLTAQDIATTQNSMNQATHGEFQSTILKTARQLALSHTGAFGEEFASELNNSKFMHKLAVDARLDIPLIESLSQQGITGQRAADFIQMRNDPNVDNFFIYSDMLDKAEEAQKLTDFRSRNTASVTRLSNIAKTHGAGQGLIKNLLTQNVHSFGGALLAAGNLVPEEVAQMQAVFDAMTPEDRAVNSKVLVDAMSEKQDAVRALKDGGEMMGREAQQAAGAKLLHAQTQLDTLGLTQGNDEYGGKLINAWLQDARKDEADAQKDVGKKAVAPPSTSGVAPPTGATSSNGPTAKVDGDIRIHVTDQHGTALPDGQWTLAARQNPGNINLVKGNALG